MLKRNMKNDSLSILFPVSFGKMTELPEMYQQ